MVGQLAERAGLPMPRVYLIEQEQPNAFATGRHPENSAVAATNGLLRRISHEEIAGVVAQELEQVKNRAHLIMHNTATLTGPLYMLATSALFYPLSVGRRAWTSDV